MRHIFCMIIVLFLLVIGYDVCRAYIETQEDTRLRLSIQKNVDRRFQKGQYDLMSGALVKIEGLLKKSQISERLRYHLQRGHLYTKRMQKTVANSSKALSPEEFLKTYEQYISSSMTEDDYRILKSCMDRYDTVDAIARRENFPTSLILATWRKESSCRVVNPSNGDGLFQIVTHDYEPSTVYQLKNLVWSGVYTQSGDFLGSGRLSKDYVLQMTGMFGGFERVRFIQSGNILEEQVMDFIKFSREKWKWYDRLQLYDTIPITLSYDKIDLLSLRKHAILYNSVAKGRHPENSFYANQNFGRDYEKKQDGLVVMLLRVIKGMTGL